MFANCHVTANENPCVNSNWETPKATIEFVHHAKLGNTTETPEGSVEFAMTLDHEMSKYIPCPNWETPEATIEFAHHAKLGNNVEFPMALDHGKERIAGNWGNNIFEGKLEGPQGELFNGHKESCVAANPVLTMYCDSSDVNIPQCCWND